MTSPWKVLVTRSLPRESFDELRAAVTLIERDGYVDLNREELIERAADVDALCAYSDVLDDEHFAALPRLKLVATHWARPGSPLAEAATRHGVLVTTPPGQYAWIVDGVAELVWGLMIAAGRRFRAADAFTRRGAMDHSEASTVLLLGEGLAGKTVGLIGAGAIGSAVAERAAGFGVELLYADPMPSARVEAVGGVRVDLDALLSRSDFISLSVPPVEENRRLIGAREFALMKPSAVFVNTARGMSVDEEALVAALREQRILGAGLDVYENEPAVHPGLLELDNVILLPHTGGSLATERTRAARAMADSIEDAAAGRVPRNLVNPDVLDSTDLRWRSA